MAELRALDAGFWFGSQFTGVKLPSLAETVAALTELDLMANVEIKSAPEGGHAELATGR